VIHPRDMYGEIERLHNLVHGGPEPPDLPQVDDVVIDEIRRLTPTGEAYWRRQLFIEHRYPDEP